MHPHTLGIASTQRVESANSALKQVLRRSGTLVNVDQAIIGKVQDDTNKTIRWAFSFPGFLVASQKVDLAQNCRPLHVYEIPGMDRFTIALGLCWDATDQKQVTCRDQTGAKRERRLCGCGCFALHLPKN